MLQLDKPHSWWFDSDTGPRRSVWLQSTISDLDEKMKAMLRLIEEDGDSFAQRAEMFYKRRPELVAMVGDFYRMHRSLAEGFDQLKSEARNRLIKPFTPPIQARKLLKMEKPYDTYSRDSVEYGVHPEQDEHLHSYVGVEDEDYAESEVDDPEVDDPEQENDTNVYGIQMGNNDECGEDFDVDYREQDHENPVAVEKFSSIHRDGEVLMLQAEVEKLKEENMILKEQLHDEYLGLIQEIEVAKLRGEMERLKEENMILKDEIETLKEENRAQKEKQESSNLIHESEAAKLRDEIVRLKVENVIHKDQLESSCLIHESEIAKLRDEIASLKSENKFREEREPDQSHGSINENKIAKALDEVESGASENMSSGGEELSSLIAQSEIAKLKDEMKTLKKENMIQKEQLLQKDEEKRQVIRQLSLSLDIMRENLSLSKKIIENHSSKKRTTFEFSKFKELFSPKKLFSGNSKSHQPDQVLLQTLI